MRPKKILLYLLILYALVTWGPGLLNPAVDAVTDQLNTETPQVIVKEHLR